MSKLYKVKLAKGFHTQVADGTRLSNLRHSRGGVTLSSPGNVETVAELTNDQVEAIKNDPAFEITSAKEDARAPAGNGTQDPAGNDPQTPAPNTPKTPADQVPTQPQSPSGQDQDGQDGANGGVPAQTSTEAGAANATATDQGTAQDQGAGTDDAGPAIPSTLKGIKKQNRDTVVAQAASLNIEVTDGESKGDIAKKIVDQLAAQTSTEE